MSARELEIVAQIDARLERLKLMRDNLIGQLADHRGLEGEERAKFVRETLTLLKRAEGTA